MEKLRGVEMVVRAADAGSFSEAARTLGITPSAVSHAVAALEKELRIAIFYRTTRQLRLTEEGQAIYGRGREILERLSELETAVARPSARLRGSLRVGLSVSLSRVIVMPAVAQFTSRHPELRLEFVVMTQPRQMHAEGVDLMLRVGDPPESALIARRVARIRFGLYAAPEYLERAGMPKAPEDLLRHACLIYRYPAVDKMLDEWAFERGAERKVVKIVHPAIVSDDREGLLAALLGGAGLARTGNFDPGWIKSGRVRRVLADWSLPGGFPIHVIYRRTPKLAPKIAAFLDFAREAFAAFDPEELTLIHEKRSFA
ncbi:MAG TPA: LysR family transcriptional regulator [Burkholderiales bacterium]|nr:LysR family transcriptional regulator [Burkholderiales bacterium]